MSSLWKLHFFREARENKQKSFFLFLSEKEENEEEEAALEVVLTTKYFSFIFLENPFLSMWIFEKEKIETKNCDPKVTKS